MNNNNVNGLIESSNEQQAQLQAQGSFPATNGLFGSPNAPLAQQPINPIDMLMSYAQKEEGTEVSLKTLKKREIEKIMDAVKKCKDIANKYYQSDIEPEVRRRLQNAEASEEMYKKKFPRLSESSNWRSRDIKTVIDWIMPSLIEVFTGSDDPVDIKGVNAEDDDNAKKIQQLLKYQLERKNTYFSFLMATLKAALTFNLGIAKAHWNRSEKREPYEMMLDGTDITMTSILAEESHKGTIEITAVEPIDDMGDFYKVSFDKIIVTANHSIVEYLPPSEFRFTPEGTNIQDCKFVAHRKIVQGDYLKRKEQEGVYQNIDKALEAVGDTKATTSEVEKNSNLTTVKKRLTDGDNASKEVELYECYLKVDYNNDGIYENLIVHCVGDEPLSIQENDFDLVPFFPACAEYDPCIVFPKEGYTDGLEQLQDLKTALIRQIIINVAKNNIPQKYINGSVDVDAMMAGEEVVQVDTNDNPQNSIFIPPVGTVSPLSMELVQYAQSEIESQSGSTKYNQGLDSNSLNRTATGITAILGQADKRIKMIAKQLAENFLVPMFKYIILQNQKYAEPEQLVRLTNENVSIKREDLDVDYDFIINVGQGAGTKEVQMQYTMVLINQIYPLLEQKGIVTAQSWYNLTKDLLEQMGLRNTTNYIIDPKSEEGMQLQQQMQQSQQAMQQAAMQQQVELLKAKAEADIAKAKVPHLSAQFDDLPVTAQAELLKSYGVNPNMRELVAEKEREANARTQNTITRILQKKP